MEALQLDLFKENSEVELLQEKVGDLNLKLGNLRRGFFARYRTQGTVNLELHGELEALKKRLDFLEKAVSA